MRPLKLKVISMPSLEKHGEPFSSPVISSLWDVVNDIAATGSVVSDAGTVNCVISLTTPGATLSGTKTATMNGNGRCTWSDLKVTNNQETTLDHKFGFTCTSTSRKRSTPGAITADEEKIIIEARTHARKVSMALDYTGPVENVQPAIDLFNKVAVDGRDDITVKPVNTGKPVDLTFNQYKIRKIMQNCRRFPSSVKNSFC
jgi:hypothetical protein